MIAGVPSPTTPTITLYGTRRASHQRTTAIEGIGLLGRVTSGASSVGMVDGILFRLPPTHFVPFILMPVWELGLARDCFGANTAKAARVPINLPGAPHGTQHVGRRTKSQRNEGSV